MKNKIMRALFINTICMFNVCGILFAHNTTNKINDPSIEVWPECPIPNKIIYATIRLDSTLMYWSSDQVATNYELVFKSEWNTKYTYIPTNKVIRFQPSVLQKNADSIYLTRVCTTMPRVQSSNKAYVNPFVVADFIPKYRLDGTCVTINSGLSSLSASYMLVSFPNADDVPGLNGDGALVTNITALNFSFTLLPGVNPQSLYILQLKDSLRIYHQVKFDGNIEPIVCTDEPLPILACGANVDTTTPTGTPLNSFMEGSVFTMKGFPVKVTSIFGNGTFSGTGKISLPFAGGKAVLITFSGVTINADKKAMSGNISVESRTLPSDEVFLWDGPQDFVDFCPDEEVLPGEFDSEGYDQNGYNKYGFNRQGDYKNGGKYDENGFDKDGLTEEGNLYDAFGCDRDGKDANNEPCKRDLDRQEINKYADSIVKSPSFIPAIAQLIASTQTSLDNAKAALNCQVLRDKVIDLTTTLQYPQLFVAGDTMKYVKLGMSRLFASEPQKLMVNSNIRNAQTVELEDTHVDLFHCDRKELELKEREDYLNQPGITQEFITYVENALKALTPFRYKEIKGDTVAFNKWREGLLNLFLIEKGYPKKYTMRKATKLPNLYGLNAHESGVLLASNNGILPISKDSYKKEMAWLYNQGFTEINGESRGLYINEMYERLESKGVFLMEDEELMQPIRVQRDTQGTLYNLYFDNIRIDTQGAIANMYVVFRHNREGANSKPIVFGAENVGFGPGGIITNGTKLVLKSDLQKKIGKYVRLTIKANTGVTISCRGFEKFDFFGKVEICPTAIYPVDPVTLEPDENSNEVFSFDFNAEIATLNDIYLEFGNIKPFVFAKAPNVTWSIGKMVFDFSQRKSPVISGISSLPSFYNNFFGAGGFANEWEGVYVDSLKAYLPSQFKDAQGNRKSISLNQAVVDKDGFSGEIKANNVLPNGNAGGWKLGINDFHLTLYQNQIWEGGFGGDVELPVVNRPFGYQATIRRNNSYKLEIKPAGDTSMTFTPFAGSQLNIHPTSRITADFVNKDLLLSANLSGKVSINNDLVKMPGLIFSNLSVDNKKNFSPGNWGLTDTAQLKLMDGFEFNLSKLLARKESQDMVSLDLGLGISLVNDKITAHGDLNILGSFYIDENGYHRWKYERTQLNQLSVDAKIGTTEVKAGLSIFRNDVDFGRGFAGRGSLKMESFGTLGAFAVFGRKEYKYFAIEAFAELKKGINAGVITFNGFGGGLSYKMDQITTGMTDPGTSTLSDTAYSSPSAAIAGLSGIRYIPNAAQGLGLFASTKIELTGAKSAFNAAALFGVQFRENWAVEKAYLKGAGLFMTKENAGFNFQSDSTSAPYNASLSAHVDFDYNFTAREFDGRLSAYLNAYALKGAGPGNKLVDGKIFIGKSNWFFHLGTPSNPAGVDFSIGGTSLANATAYFCLGTDIPDIAPLPANLYQILPKYQSSLVSRKSSKGIAFGTRFKAGFDLDIVVARASLEAAAGFDISLTEYKDFLCQGTNIPIQGINGWYAKAQIYAYLNGKLSVLGKDVLNLGVGMVLQGQLPNPSFAQGSAGYSLKTWFGTKQGSFTVKLGQPCVPISPSVSDESVELIDFLVPTDSAQNVDITSSPQASLYFPADEVIEIPGLTNKYRIQVVKDELRSLKTGNYISASRKISGSSISTEPVFIPTPGDSMSYTVSVELYKNGSKVKTETKTIVFKYGEGALKNIPISWVRSSYPIINMENFYTDEFKGNGGFIALDRSVQSLLQDKIVKAEFSTQGSSFESDVEINGALIKFGYDRSLFKPGSWNIKLFYRDEENKENKKQYILSYAFTVSPYKTLTQKLATNGAKMDPLEKNTLVKIDFKYTDVNSCLNNLSSQISGLSTVNGCSGNSFTIDQNQVQQILQAASFSIEEKMANGQNSIGQLKSDIGNALEGLVNIVSPAGACSGNYTLNSFQTGCVIREYADVSQQWYFNVDVYETIRTKLNDDSRKIPYTLQYSIPGISLAYTVPNDIIYENLKQN